jgi:hypothetical protein
VLLEVIFEPRNTDSIYAGRAFVLDHAIIGKPQVTPQI